VEGHGDNVLLFVGCCVCACSPARGGERREILGCWSLGLQMKNLNEGFDANKPIGPAALTLMDRQTCVSSAHG
jgi:hypothetical protein